MTGAVMEITERKSAEEKIRRAAEEWKKTFDSISDFIFILDPDFNIVKANKAFSDALKLKPEDIIGKKCHKLLHKTDEPWPGCPCKKTFEDKKPHTEEIDDLNIGIPLLATSSPVFDDKGRVISCVHIARDISKIKKSEKEIKRKMHDLEIFHKVAVGRELEISRMKKRIKELERKLEETP
ncbi:unnamed protein product [marine sediment metagenome]|uniref:PAS domain-containing protein n=1 Tax=marine sediment metagenome TaxID=412755 RepID=X0UIJ6_9ZZZZ